MHTQENDAELAQQTAYNFPVDEVFSFSDGSTVFVGLPSNSKIRLVPAQALILLDGEEIGQITLTEYRMPGPVSPRIPLVSRDPVDADRLRTGICKLVCTLLPQKG